MSPWTSTLLWLTGAMILSFQSELLQFSWLKFMVMPFIPLHGFTLNSCLLLTGNCRLDCSPYFDRVHLNKALEFNVAMHQARQSQEFFSQKYIRPCAQSFIENCASKNKAWPGTSLPLMSWMTLRQVVRRRSWTARSMLMRQQYLKNLWSSLGLTRFRKVTFLTGIPLAFKWDMSRPTRVQDLQESSAKSFF